jgi:hypothetical protein
MDADPVGLPLPRADQTVESTHSLVLDGDHFRVEHDDPGFRRQVPTSGDGVETFDGDRSCHRIYVDGRDKPAHLIMERAAGRPEFIGSVGWPLVFWCRGGRREPYGVFDTRTHTADLVLLDGRQILRIRSGDLGGPSATTYDLDARRDFVVRRIRQEYSGTVEVTDVDYREQPGIGWVPAGWTTVKTRAGDKLVYRIRAEVIDVRINEPVPAGTFRLEPLPGESFTDNDAKKTYQVRADGSLEEYDRNAVTVAPREPPPRPVSAWPGRTLVRFVLLPALAIALIGGLIVRRRRRPPHTPSP